MNYYCDFNLFSQFKYGVGHIKNGSTNLIRKNEPTQKLNALGEIALGSLEILPALGIVSAYTEKRVRNARLTSRLRQRNLFIKEDIKSDSFALQELYFDVSSSRLRGKKYLRLSTILDNSTPDRQIYSLIKDLKNYLAKNPAMIPKLKICLNKLKATRDVGLIISCIISTSSIDEKNRLKDLLKDTIKRQLEELEEDDYLLIPCGYMNGNIYDLSGVQKKSVNGHSMLMKVVKMPGSYEVTIFNTGDGFRMHSKDQERSGNIYPLSFDSIPADSILDDAFLETFVGFSLNEDPDKQVKGKHVYKSLIQNFGKPKKINDEDDKSYHKQGTINNCTKKCLQVWLHNELKNDPELYQDFRCFRLQAKIDQVLRILSKNKKSTSYTQPMAKWGATNGVSFGKKNLQRYRGFLGGSSVKIDVSRKETEKLVEYAERLLRKRIAKRDDVPFDEVDDINQKHDDEPNIDYETPYNPRDYYT